MTTAGFENYLRQKAGEAPVPELRLPSLEQDTPAWEPVVLYDTRPGPMPALAATAAALVMVSGAALGYAAWDSGRAPYSGGSSGPGGAAPGTSVAQTSAATVSQTTTVPVDPLLVHLADCLRGEIPDIQPEQIDMPTQTKGHFTRTDREQAAYICRYAGSDEEPQRFYLILEEDGRVWTQAFGNTCVGILSVQIGDLTGDGFDDWTVALYEGGSSSGSAVHVLSAAGGELRLLLANGGGDGSSHQTDFPSVELGFFCEALPDYRFCLKNRYTDFEEIVDVSASKDAGGLFDEEGRPDTDSVEFDEGDGVELTELNGKTVLKYGSCVWFDVHVNTIGYAYAYLAYEPEQQRFVVVKAEFEPGLRTQ